MIPWELKEKIMSSTTRLDRNVDRRDFLKLAFAAGANVTCLPCGVTSAQQNRSQEANEQSTAREQMSLAGIKRPNILKSHGYATAHFGKWHLGLPARERNKPTPIQHGFDYWFATGNNAAPSHRNPVNFIRNGKPVGIIKETLRKNGTLEQELRGSTLQAQMFEGFLDKEAERLRGQYIRLNMFQESWIPLIKSGNYGRFELFDLAKDPGQQKDLSAQLPDVLSRLKKKLLEINASVMADAHDWHLK